MQDGMNSKAKEKQRTMWIVLGIVAALIGLGLWMSGRSKDARFSADALRRRFFGGGGKGGVS